MARLWSSGWESNSVANGVEFGATIGSPTITSTAAKVRSGTYAGQISGLVSATQKYFQYTIASANANGPFFVSVYVFFDTFPSAANAIFTLTASNGTNIATIKVDNTGAFTLFNTATQVGSASSTIATGGWHKLDIQFNATGGAGAGILRARLDDVEFAGASNLTIGSGVQTCNVGGNIGSEAQTTGTWYFDDWKVNDNTGSNETSYPGTGKIIHLKPAANGDTVQFATGTGGTGVAPTGNYTRVQEVTPNDTTNYNTDHTLNNLDVFTLDPTPSDLNSGATINCVQVGLRFARHGSTGVPTITCVLESQASGTKVTGTTVTGTNATWHTNNFSDPRNYVLTSYTDPQSGGAWTKALLDTAQAGYKTMATTTNGMDVSTVWVLVDYTPSSGTLYTSSLTATYSASGALTKTTNRLHSSSYSASGVLTRLTSRLLTATYKGSGVIVARSIVRLLAAAVYGASGALAWVHQHYLVLTGTYSVSGALTRRAVTRIFSAAYSASAILNRFISRLFTAAYSGSGSLTKGESRTISGTYSASGIITSRSIKRSFVVVYQASGAIISRAITKSFSAVYQGSGVLSNRSIARLFTATYQAAGSLSRSVARLLSAAYSTAGSLASSLVHGTHLMSLSGSYSASGQITSKAITRAFTGSYVASGVLVNRTVNRLLAATYSASGTLKRLTSRLFPATYSASGLLSAIQSHTKSLSGIYSASGLITIRSVGRTFTAAYSASGTLVRAITRTLTAVYTSSGSIIGRTIGRLLLAFHSFNLTGYAVQCSAGAQVSTSTVPWDFSANVQGAYAFWYRLTDFNKQNGSIFNPGTNRLDVNVEANSNKVFLWFSDSTNVGHLVWKSSVSQYDGKWHQLIVNKTATGIDAYNDGILVGSFTTGLTTFALTSSAFFGNSQGFVATAELRIWNRSLTGTEVTNYISSNTIPSSGLVLEWLLNEGSGTIAHDTSASSNDGALSTSPAASWITGHLAAVSLLKTTGIPFTAIYSASGSLRKQVGRSFGAVYSATGSFLWNLTRLLSAFYSTSGSLTSLKSGSHSQAFTATYSAAGTLLKSTRRNLQANYVASGSLVKNTVRILAGGVYSASGNLAKTAKKFFTATYVASGFWSFIYTAFVVNRPVISLIINTLNPNRTVNDTTPTKDISGQTTDRNVTEGINQKDVNSQNASGILGSDSTNRNLD